MDKSKLGFDDVYDEFYKKVGRYVERMVGKEEAEDVTQEVFVKVNKGLEGFKGESSLSTWIYKIATNAALDKIHSRSFQEGTKRVSLEAPGDDAEAENKGICMETSLTAEREAIRNEMNECIREFVDKLPENYRTVIILSELKDLKNQDIADVLGVSLDTVKIRLHRARARLKEEFEAGCEFYRNEDNELACDRKSEDSEKNEA
ncbi:MAG: sigma-70 family RNA polymerase sigma factor [Phycisphaerae bacterium]|nr:sigma-70 family RNA polymerase sigma factor [Phycisphaerae bacterium]NIP53254.1 sigma-70 family RNA polymerase sigma factor [Phycisphaerae bacterium]NIS52281.1 sigma-70 family RNA polymerase sigma factor [Phycisphaerae bacterium]NIU09826.1 sigma-70 family RNA polymerase sigma factor [Phycisphaerae bacterium]NIU59464.1 sigma-70 family RNA polymerase sigma factor [Phycisphaerae bacterium]